MKLLSNFWHIKTHIKYILSTLLIDTLILPNISLKIVSLHDWLICGLTKPWETKGDNFQNKCSMIQCIYMYRVVYDTFLEAARTFDQLTIWTWNWHTQLSWPWTKLCWATKWTNWDILYYFLSTILAGYLIFFVNITPACRSLTLYFNLMKIGA